MRSSAVRTQRAVGGMDARGRENHRQQQQQGNTTTYNTSTTHTATRDDENEDAEVRGVKECAV